MAERQRSPFGERVYTYRMALNLTQAQLAQRANSTGIPGVGAISLRTISAIERRYAPGEAWSRPYRFTVEALGVAFNLQPNTPEWEDFVQASRQERHHPPTTASDPDPMPPLFVAAGREQHLAKLERAIDAAASGDPGVMFVGANPGTGKTSLIAHVTRRAVDRHPRLTVLWGDCTSSSVAADPYQPFRQAFDVMSGNFKAASPRHIVSAANRHRLARRLPVALAAIVAEGRGLMHRVIPPGNLAAQADNAALDPALASSIRSLAATPTTALDAVDLNEQVYRTLAHYASSGPTILILEDLHWADPQTATLIFHLVHRLHEQHIPLLVIGSYRPLELDANGPGNRSQFQTILNETTRFFVDPIIDMSNAVGGEAGQAYVDAIIAATVESAPANLRELLFDLTEGLPLFVAAIIRWYQSQRAGAARNDVGSWQLDPTHLPTEIDAFFANQVNRLPADLQSLLDAASVQGHVFSAEVLQEVAGISRSELLEKLARQLGRRFHIVAPSGVHSIAGLPGHNYQFIHALLRDYLYYRMTDLEREYHHVATANALRTLYGDAPGEASARIAFHFDQAGEREAAGHHYLNAGNHALDFYDYTRARAMFLRIHELDLMSVNSFLPAQAHVGLGNSARGNRDFDRARHHFARAIDLAQRHNLPLVQANALTSLAMLDYDAGHMRQGSQFLGQAVNALFEHGDLTEACRSLSLLSLNLLGVGHYDEAAIRASKALELARELGNDMLLTGAQIAIGNCYLETGQYPAAIATFEECLALCEELGNTHRAVICLLNLAHCHLETGESRRARASLAEVFDRRDQVHQRLLGAAEFNAGLIDEFTLDVDAAYHHYRESLRLREDSGQTALAVDSQTGLLRVALAHNRQDDIASLLDAITTTIGTHGVEGIEHLGRLYATLALAWNVAGRPDLARRAAMDGLAMVSERAALIANPDVRSSYLENIPGNRAIRDLATVAAIDPSSH